MHRRAALDRFTGRKIVDDQLERAQHGGCTWRLGVEIVAQRAFERAHVDPAIGLGYPDPLAEQLDRLRRVTAPAQSDDGRHARIIPAGDDVFIDQLAQLAFAGDHIRQVQAREFVLMRHRLLEKAAFGERGQQPVVKWSVILEFKRAHRMRDVFDRVRNRVRVVIHRVNAPGAAGAMMVRVANPVNRRIAHGHIRRSHRVGADFGAQNVFAVFVLAGFHIAKNRQRFASRPIAKRRIDAGRAEIAAVFLHIVGALAINVGKAGCDQVFGHQIQLLEIIAGVMQMADTVLLPTKTEPLHAVDDGIDVFLLFFGRIGVVKAQMTDALIIARQAKVEANRLGVADVQITVRFRREPRDHRWQAVALISAGGHIRFDNRAQKVR